VDSDGGSELTIAAAVPSSAPIEGEPLGLAAHLAPEIGFKTLRYGETPCPALHARMRGRCFRLDVRRADGSEGVRWVVELGDRGYRYPIHLAACAARAAEGLAVLERVVASISPLDPLPLPVAHDGQSALTLFAWVVP